jgi:hypothetical protein
LILKFKNGDSFIPPSISIRSQNNACSSPASPWVDELKNQGVLSECKENPFLCCSDAPVDIRQLSEFMSYALEKP